MLTWCTTKTFYILRLQVQMYVERRHWSVWKKFIHATYKKNSFKDYWRLRSIALSHPGAHIYTRSADEICFAIVCTFPSWQANDLIPPYRSVIVICRWGFDTIVIYLDILWYVISKMIVFFYKVSSRKDKKNIS